MNLYEIIFKVGRNHRRWCRFANSEEQAQAEIIETARKTQRL